MWQHPEFCVTARGGVWRLFLQKVSSDTWQRGVTRVFRRLVSWRHASLLSTPATLSPPATLASLQPLAPEAGLRVSRLSVIFLHPFPRRFTMAPSPLPHKKIVKKRTLHFKRHQSDEYVKVKDSWRRPRGIDSRERRK